MDDHSLALLEFDRVTASVAACAASAAARARLAAARPIADRTERARECARLAEALRRHAESGEWCEVGESDVTAVFAGERERPLEGVELVAVRGWLEAGRRVAEQWRDPELAKRYAELFAYARDLPEMDSLRRRLTAALEPDGRVSDAASPALARARRELANGERSLEQRVTAWAQDFGENAYVTRHGDRFVALIPAAGFSRRRGIVHDVSGSGQSLFVEPLEACEANNRLLEVRALVTEEEQRVLRELGAEVWKQRDAVLGLVETLVALDALRARARWASGLGAIALTPGGERLRLRGARHPLLALVRPATGAPRPAAALARPETVVPLDLELAGDARVLLVSGPNMGGKTILLKTVGLAVACAHAAFPVPAAEGSAVPEIDDIRVDLGDEQSVDQGLSTFAAHLRSLAAMAEAASPRSLLLADELGAGTDPEEGAALARALVEHFAARGAWGVMTSHLGSLKRLAGEVAGVVNGSMEFDLEALAPRYRFLPGVPGASHALSIAERLGFPAGVLARARSITPEESRALERLIGELHIRVRDLEVDRAAVAASRAEADAALAEHRRATEVARQTLEDLRRRLTRESEALLARARELWQTVQREAKRAEKTRGTTAGMRGALEQTERDIEALQRTVEESLPASARATLPPESLGPGRRVRVTDLDVEAEVLSAPDAEGKVVLQRGSWTIHSHISRLAPVVSPTSGGAPVRTAAHWESSEEGPSLELDLRGMEVDEALRAVDTGLDRAVLAGLGELRIVHGIGKGILRAAVERHLRGHPQVQLARLGEGHEGGRGATVAKLR